MSKSKNSAKSEYAERLKAYRKTADVSQENLAKALGVHQPYIAAIEAGTISIGIDKQEEIANFFGVKHYKFSDPETEIPSREDLRESISIYVKSRNIDPGYLDNEGPNYSKYLDFLLETDFLSQPRTAREIADELMLRYHLEISPTRITDILTRPPRKELVTVSKSEDSNRNRYQIN